MNMQARHHTPTLIAFALLVFGAALLAHEHFNGGVRSHHLLDRSDLPAISNWFGLIVLPLLGWLLGVRLRNQQKATSGAGLPTIIWAGLVYALLYGAAMAMFFELGTSSITTSLLLGLFLLAAVLPIYRIECICGFVVGMSFTFGAVLPTLVAVVFATISFLVRFAFRTGMSAMRSPNRQR